MTFDLNIPSDAENAIRAAWGSDIGRAALEALAIEGYRTAKLSRFDVQTLLGFEDRWETEAWLGERGVALNYSQEDLESDRVALDRGLGPITR